MKMTAKLTLGPIAYHWSAEMRRDFYARIADEAPIDDVYLGEVICSKRAPFHEPDLTGIIERLHGGCAAPGPVPTRSREQGAARGARTDRPP